MVQTPKESNRTSLDNRELGTAIMRRCNQIVTMLTFLASRQGADEEMGRVSFFLKTSEFNGSVNETHSDCNC
jgi:hypothetical protein